LIRDEYINVTLGIGASVGNFNYWTVTDPVIKDDVMYFPNTNDSITARAIGGSDLWQTSVIGNVTSIAVSDDSVFVTTEENVLGVYQLYLYGLDREDGSELAGWVSNPVLVDSNAGDLSEIILAPNDDLSDDFIYIRCDEIIRVHYQSNGSVWSSFSDLCGRAPPVVDDGSDAIVLFSVKNVGTEQQYTQYHYLSIYDQTDKTFQYRHELGRLGSKDNYYSPVLFDSVVYFPKRVGDDYYLLGVDITDNQTVFNWTIPGEEYPYCGISTAPLVTNDLVFVTLKTGYIYAVNRQTQSTKWSTLMGEGNLFFHDYYTYGRYKDFYFSPSSEDSEPLNERYDGIVLSNLVLKDGMLYAGTFGREHFLCALEAETGDVIWKKQTNGAACGLTVYGRDIFARTFNGTIERFGNTGTDPMDIDVDGDGLSDGFEIEGYQGYDVIEAEDHAEVFHTWGAIGWDNRTSVGLEMTTLTSEKTYLNAKYHVEPDKTDRYSLAFAGPCSVIINTNGNPIDDEIRSKILSYSIDLRLNALDTEVMPNGSLGSVVQFSSWEEKDDYGSEYVEAHGWLYYFKEFELDAGDRSLEFNVTLHEDNGKIMVDGNIYNVLNLNLTLDLFSMGRTGTDPFDRDSDDDILDDGTEYRNYWCPHSTDPDEDGLSDTAEYYLYDTNPVYRDTDFDGVRDRVELGLSGETDDLTEYDVNSSMGSVFERDAHGVGKYSYENLITNNDADVNTTTDPTERDSDGDGLPDGSVDAWFYMAPYSEFWYYGSALRNWTTWGEYWRYNLTMEFWEGEDFNLDGKVDGGDYELDGYISIGGETDPENPDSDGDDLPDGWEAWYHMDPLNDTGRNGPDYDLDGPLDYDIMYPWDLSEELEDYIWGNYICGDGATNLEEYLAGTSPWRRDSDNDSLEDGLEMDSVVFRTNVEEGALRFDSYGSESDWIWYNFIGDLAGGGVVGKEFGYHETVEVLTKSLTDYMEYDKSPGAPDNRQVLHLNDGTILIYNMTTDEMFVWGPVSEMDYNESDGNYTAVYHRYTVADSQSEADTTTTPLLGYYLMERFTTDGLCNDTDLDGIEDGIENWPEESINPTFYLWDPDEDGMIAARDIDSEGDGVLDKDEIRWYYTRSDSLRSPSYTKHYINDSDEDDYPNTLDTDSDNDGLTDSVEMEYDTNESMIAGLDPDLDGFHNMVDRDSDNDGLPDGWIDGWKWNASAPVVLGWRGTNYNINIGTQDYFEGEDFNGDGLIAGDTDQDRFLNISNSETWTETDPFNWDSDLDMLCDGFNTTTEPAMTFEYQTITRVGELEYSFHDTFCDNKDNDTDDDGVLDGVEVFGWILIIEELDFNPMINNSKEIIAIGHPVMTDSDGDGLNDGSEFDGGTDPSSIDTDWDGRTDYIEINGNVPTDPADQDTDDDMIVDGFWDYNEDGTIEFTEGEDIDNDGYVDAGETDPTDADCDDDAIPDGYEKGMVLARTLFNGSNAGTSTFGIFDDEGNVIMVTVNSTELYAYLDTFYNYDDNLPVNHYLTRLWYDTSNGYEIYVEWHLDDGFYIEDRVVLRSPTTDWYIRYDPLTDVLWENYAGSPPNMGIYHSLKFNATKLSDRGYFRTNETRWGETWYPVGNAKDSTTDGDGLNDTLEFFKLCNYTNRGVSLLLCDIDGDDDFTLFDDDSDGDTIDDDDDLWTDWDVTDNILDHEPYDSSYDLCYLLTSVTKRFPSGKSLTL